jgi:hypothetical protein
MENLNIIGKTVFVGDAPSLERVAFVCLGSNEVGSGEMVKIQFDKSGKSVVAAARVTSGLEQNPYETPQRTQVMDALGISSSEIDEDSLGRFKVYYADLLEFVYHDGSMGRPSGIVPSGSPVSAPDEDFVRKVLGMPLPNEADSLNLATLGNSDNISVTLSANKTLPRHILVVGTTGSGKSYFVGKAVEEVSRIGIPVIIVDIHGEYIKETEELKGTVLRPGVNLRIRLDSLEESEVLGMLPITNELHTNIAARAFSDLKMSGRPFGVREYENKVREVAIDIGSTKGTQTIMEARIRSLNTIKILGDGIKWDAILSKGAVIDVDCRDLTRTYVIMLVGAMARELYNLRKSGKIPPLVLALDEAHIFLPASGSSGASFVLGEIVRMGRHAPIGAIISTQHPSDIDQATAKITNTRFIFAIEPSELGSLGGLLGDMPPETVNYLTHMEQGECLLVGNRETIRHSVTTKISKRKTTPGGDTPRMIQNG